MCDMRGIVARSLPYSERRCLAVEWPWPASDDVVCAKIEHAEGRSGTRVPVGSVRSLSAGQIGYRAQVPVNEQARCQTSPFHYASIWHPSCLCVGHVEADRLLRARQATWFWY